MSTHCNKYPECGCGPDMGTKCHIIPHTPTPWIYVVNTSGVNSVQYPYLILQNRPVNAANIATVIPCIGMTQAEIEANARRIVECVNACAGISNPLEFIKRASKNEIELGEAESRLIELNAELNNGANQYAEVVCERDGLLESGKHLLETANQLGLVAGRYDNLLQISRRLLVAIKYRLPSYTAILHEVQELENALSDEYKIQEGGAS